MAALGGPGGLQEGSKRALEGLLGASWVLQDAKQSFQEGSLIVLEPQGESILAISSRNGKMFLQVDGMCVGQWTTSKESEESEDSGKRSAPNLARAIHPEGWAADPSRFAKAAARRWKETHIEACQRSRVFVENDKEKRTFYS